MDYARQDQEHDGTTGSTMKRASIAFVVIFSSVIAAHAAPALNDAGEQYTYAQLLSLNAAFSALDGYQQVVKDGAQTHVVPTPYTFTAGVREAIADDEIALQPIMNSENQKIQAFAKTLGDGVQKYGTAACVKDAECKQFIDEGNKIEGDEFTLKLTQLTLENLDLSENSIPPSVIAALSPIISH
jgi:hypothetical protein